MSRLDAKGKVERLTKLISVSGNSSNCSVNSDIGRSGTEGPGEALQGRKRDQKGTAGGIRSPSPSDSNTNSPGGAAIAFRTQRLPGPTRFGLTYLKTRCPSYLLGQAA